MATSIIYTLGSQAPLNQDAAAAYGDYCFCCGRKLGKKYYLMHVNTDWELVAPDYDGVDSQGCFPIGSTCKDKFAADAIFQHKN